MNVEIKAVHFDLLDEQKELIQKKIHKLDFAQDLLVDCLVTLTKEKDYIVECTINMRLGITHHFRVEDFDFRAGVDRLFSKVDQKISREKDKIKGH